MKCSNPFAFRPGRVTFWTTVIYLALIIPLIYVHETVPPAPSNRSLYRDLNLTEAWLDLQKITRAFHPYNSHENDEVREFLIERSKDIMKRNQMPYKTDTSGGTVWHELTNSFEGDIYTGMDTSELTAERAAEGEKRPRGATLFDDQISNVTWISSDQGIAARQKMASSAGQYFEGNNFYIYIHGKNDPPGEWWLSEDRYKKFRGEGGVLVNSHFDSVSTGYGATDDGMGCVSMLQLLSYFTSEDHQPTNGIVLLFNNAEEEGLLGARAFGYSPLLQFCHTFVNLEGAGAGGRAILFRTTDVKAAQAYGKSPHPFGSVVAADAFKRGVIASGTDYQIWNDNFGQRGVDIAFYAPRARYHTTDDDARHTSVNSIWHMLSAALATTKELSQTTGTAFHGPRSDGKNVLVQNGKQADGVWFDLFGSAWAVFALRGLFAWSLTLLVATPLVLLAVSYGLARKDKYYFFAKDIKMHYDINDEPVVLGGWKGFFRFPFAFVFAVGLTIGATMMVARLNPLIVYSSGYAVWAMAISIFYFSFWLIMRGASFVRPSALQRGFVLLWLYILGWALQVFAAVAEDRMQLGGLYSSVFIQTAVFLSLLISLVEQFSLLGKHEFAMQLHDAHQARDLSSHSRNQAQVQSSEHVHEEDVAADDADEGHDNDDGDDEEPPTPTERTPLRSSEPGYGSQSFANTYRRSVAENSPAPPSMREYQPSEHEQSWSGRLPSSTWILQFLLLAPVPVILVGNLGLISMSALQMTGTDGGNLLVPLLAIAIFSIILLLPITPFIHRVTHHVPLFLLCVFVGTLIYNLTAFPFSNSNRFKFFFQQTIDVNTNENYVVLAGIEKYSRQVLASLPHASGQTIECYPHTAGRKVQDCRINGSDYAPNLVDGKRPAEFITLTPLESTQDSTVSFQLNALDTRVCALETSRNIYGFSVEGGASRDPRFGRPPSDGFKFIQLSRRDREVPWKITLQLNESLKSLDEPVSEAISEVQAEDSKEELKVRGATGSSAVDIREEPFKVKVKCAWSDANKPGAIPALHELIKYMPTWAVLTKVGVALVEVRQTFTLS